MNKLFTVDCHFLKRTHCPLIRHYRHGKVEMPFLHNYHHQCLIGYIIYFPLRGKHELL